MTFTTKIKIVFSLAILLMSVCFSAEGQYIGTVHTGQTGVVYKVHGNPGSIFTWTVTGGTFIPSNADSIIVNWGNNPGTYPITVVENTVNGCSGDLVSGNVLVKEFFGIHLGNDTTLCEGANLLLDAGNQAISYIWNNNPSATSRFYTVNQTGLYWVDATNSQGDVASDTIAVTVQPRPQASITTNDGTINNGVLQLCPGNTAILNATDGLNGSNNTYLWSTGDTYKSISVSTTPLNLKVEITSQYGCQDTAYLDVLACTPSDSIFIPNAFTPGTIDGKNDTWEIKNLDILPNREEVSVEVFDRWGRMVFKSANGYPKPWDGTFNGSTLPMDSYFYIIKLGNGYSTKTGTVSIIR
jgi:gliding motility-associated-like protein